MSTGEFALHLQQSVQAHLTSIERMASDAKARVTASVADPRPSVAQPAVAFEDVPMHESAAAPPVARVAFDDDPAFMAATRQPAVSYDDLLLDGHVDDGIPVWEDPP